MGWSSSLGGPSLFLFASIACGAQSHQEVAPLQKATTVKTPTKAPIAARQSKLFKELRGLVAELVESGRYDCCIEIPCSHCAMMSGGCSCGEGLRRGEPVCEECAIMWVRGLGAETGIDPATVRSFLEAERIINAKAKAHPGVTRPGKSQKHKH